MPPSPGFPRTCSSWRARTPAECCACRTRWKITFFSRRRRHTRCLSGWSSDVCSSDLRTVTASAPSVRSARWSLRAPVRAPGCCWAPPNTLLVNRDPAGVDDRADLRVARLGHPGEELGGFALGDALGDHPEVTHAAVLPGLGVAQRAGDALVADRVDARGVGEGHEANRLRAAVHGVLLEAVGGLGGRARGDLLGFAEEDVLEGVLRTRGAVAVEQVDRARGPCPRDLAPVADATSEYPFDAFL